MDTWRWTALCPPSIWPWAVRSTQVCMRNHANSPQCSLPRAGLPWDWFPAWTCSVTRIGVGVRNATARIRLRSSRLTEAVVGAFTGAKTPDSRQVGAVLKHFCAQGASKGVRNMFPALIGERELWEIHFPPMEAGVAAVGCMAAYNEIGGVPCHANGRLLAAPKGANNGFFSSLLNSGKKMIGRCLYVETVDQSH